LEEPTQRPVEGDRFERRTPTDALAYWILVFIQHCVKQSVSIQALLAINYYGTRIPQLT